ncbi:hypothetical protein MFIFM68171_06918 [Madurella fahalii]|uniref:Uncharacterized protein n=1 Tax=Madurella fahalii TaxID=1157608 RepID=A0ABQ0GG23_9PEZI
MAVQLPSGAAGHAAGILFYSFVCLALGLVLVWLVWVHHERKSYVALLSSFMALHTVASIIQQIHTIVLWRDIKTSQYDNLVANVGNPELNITGASTGLDLVLFYIQYYSYNVESMLVLFWAVELANSVFQLRFSKMYRFHASIAAKATAVTLPAVQMILLRFSPVQRTTAGFMALADAIMIACFAAGSLVLFAILARYFRSRITLASWNVRYGQFSGTGTNGTRSGTPHAPPVPRRKVIYDNWLILRFTVAFIALSLFQLVVIVFQLRAASTNDAENIPPEPDLGADRAKGDFALFAPGVSAGLLTFIVFGTTRTFREYMWALFVPRALREKVKERATRGRMMPASASGQLQPQRGGVDTDEEAGDGGAGLRLQDMGRKDRDGDVPNARKDDEWPILKPTSPVLLSWRR